ncbi:histidine phosphatase family protein [Frigoribacterium sp. ACAM 257]|uniref:histidine phosphatase family protein n=1 Tax=Frigoribacterium sp. ACAM 257 TaxID=2508998 RepID=UPI0011B9D109|nr:histidine phosphatase family protein [Frigoribacterium sp. ACAM 257]TWX38477.1 histidine phosphatase family protein [Frigoribacterium sp. ACAM 257]
MRILLVRHGQSTANAAGAVSSAAPGPDLTDLGREQAEALAEQLGIGRVDAVYASTLVRAQQTAAPLAARLGLDIIVRDGLHEIEAGDLEDRTDEEALRGYVLPLVAWAGGDLTASAPGAPDGHAFFERFDAAIGAIVDLHDAADDASVVVVGHGAATRVWLGGRALNVDPEFTTSTEMENTGVIEISGSPATGWTVESWQGAPVGVAAPNDPTGEALDEV